ncbi:MAG: VWA domain-containing protein [Verrucomicrobia bacterium]|nr:VWA domain-containing protein [Verrucomicrobiota bacterium]MCH8526336.1 VWA domain-containing protein [Kiritimatiellia bacterium]
MNPLLPLETLIPLMVALAAGVLLTAKKTSGALPAPWRSLSPLLRLCTLLCMGVLLFNPGEFRALDADLSGNAWVLLDRSGSMDVAGRSDESTRFETAKRLIAALPDEPRARVRVLPFADALEPEQSAADLDSLSPDGTGTDFVRAVRGALDRAQSHPHPARGLLILTDGIPTTPVDREPGGELEALALRARANRIPVSAVRIGSPVERPDLDLRPHQDLLTVTAGSERAVRGTVRSRHLPPLRKRLVLRDESGRAVAETRLDLPENSDTPFTLHTPELEEGLHSFRLELEADPSEARVDNNVRDLRVHAVEINLNVLLLEGIPHWDSKFLAQWFRGRQGVRLTTLHRLADNRFFRVEPDSPAPRSEDSARLPGEALDFREFDLILLGRGMDYLFTHESTAALHRFVRDHGGAVIFTRGRPVTVSRPALESLLPVEWREDRSDLRLARPTRSGANAGLFGDLLPGMDSEVWQQLPPLRGLRNLRLTDGMAAVLLEAAEPGEDSAWPVMIRRPYGNGQLLLLNGEGMWHWDFQADALAEDRWYGDFWTQVLLWTTQAARFQPGRTWSLDWEADALTAGTEIRLHAERRLPRDEPATRPPRVIIRDEAGGSREAVLYPSGRGGALTGQWTPDAPGLYWLTVIEEGDEEASDSPRPLRVPPPPGELDQLDPQDEPLRTFVERSGGLWLEDEDPARAFTLETTDVLTPTGEAVWHPRWARGGILFIMMLFPLLEWGLRRRMGLI